MTVMKRDSILFYIASIVMILLMSPVEANAQELCQGDSCDNALVNCQQRCQPSPYYTACTYLCLYPYANCQDMMQRSRRLNVWRRGEFFLSLQAEQMSEEYDWHYPESSYRLGLGNPGDLPIGGNYLNGSLKHSLNVWRASTGTWYHSTNPSLPYELLEGERETPRQRQFGLWADIPVAEDFHYQVWRPANGTWYRQKSSGCAASESAANVESIQWGLPGDLPLTARFKVRGAEEASYPAEDEKLLAVYRPQDGGWYIRFTDPKRIDERFLYYKQWGLPEDHPMPADYDGDGYTDLAVWRPSTGHWYICPSSNDYDCSNPIVRQFGLPQDVPLTMDYDEDGKTDFAVWRRSTGTWYILHSSDGRVSIVQWGRPGDLPLGMGVRDQVAYLYPGYLQ